MGTKIKTVYLIDRLDIGGTEKQLLETIRRLDKSMFMPYLVCLHPSNYFDEVNVDCEKKVLHVNSLINGNGFLKLVSFSSFLRKQKIDIIQTFFFDSVVFGVLAGKMGGVKKILVSRRDLGFWYTPPLLSVLRLINRFVDGFLVNSEAVKECVATREKVAREKIAVIRNGVDIPSALSRHELYVLRHKLRILDSDHVVGIVANLNRRVKRVDLFIKTGKIVLEKKKNVKFIIVGDGSLKKELQCLCEHLGISKNIIFVGQKDNTWPFIQLFDVGVLCSDSEGCSNALLEYMANGVPVVASDVGGNRELISHGYNGFLAPVGNSELLAEYIIKLLEKKELRAKMGQGNRLRAEEDFKWSRIISMLSQYYLN